MIAGPGSGSGSGSTGRFHERSSMVLSIADPLVAKELRLRALKGFIAIGHKPTPDELDRCTALLRLRSTWVSPGHPGLSPEPVVIRAADASEPQG